MSAMSHPGTPSFDARVTDAVRAATMEAEARPRRVGFSLTKASAAHHFMAGALGLYLAWAVARVPEVFPALAIPRLPMVLAILFLSVLAVSVQPNDWRILWSSSLPLRLVAVLVALGFITAPVGIWVSGSVDALINRYSIAVVVFLSCLVFFRDRSAMRTGIAIYVACVAAIAIYTFLQYDPNAMILTEDGDLISRAEAGGAAVRTGVGISLDANDWGAVLVATIPLALWLGTKSSLGRLVWGAVAVLLTASIVPTASRGSLVGLVAVALALIAVGATGWRRFLLLGFVGLGGLAFMAVATEGQLTRLLDFGTDDYNLTNEGRLFFWRQGIVWMLKRPWGYGIDNFPTYFGWLNGPERAAHSMWIQYGVELGLLGLAAFIFLCATVWRGNLRNRRQATALRTTEPKLANAEVSLAGHVVAMLAGVMVTGSFLSNAYYPLTYMALGIGAAALLGYPWQGQEAAAVPAAATTNAQRGRGVTRLRRAQRNYP